MNTIDATVSMLKTMPEEAVELVFHFTERLFFAQSESGPFAPVTAEQVLSDLAESRRQIEAGQGLDMRKALEDIGRRHGLTETPSDEEVMELSRKLMEQYHDAYAALAK